jgi:hypothetical protein
MPFPIPFYRRTPPPDVPAIVQSVIPQTQAAQQNRPLFKAPPLRVQMPPAKAIKFDADMRDRNRAV